MKKRILSLILTAVMLLTCIPIVLTTTAVADEAISFSSITFTAYKGWMDADAGGQTRYKQRGYGLGLETANKSLVSGDVNSDSGGTIAFKGYSYATSNYYPEIYLASDGQLARDNYFDNKEVDVNLTDYMNENISGHPSGTYGKYYGYYKLSFSSAQNLKTFRFYCKTGDYHLTRGFDILVSANGTNWVKRASFTGMGSSSNWDGSATIDGGSCYYKDLNMGGANVQYIAFAVTQPSVKSNCCLWYATATSGTAALEAGTETELRNMMAYANNFANMTVNITSDITCSSPTTPFGTMSQTNFTLNGQNHTIYNLQGKLLNYIAAPGAKVKNLIISNKSSSGGSVMSEIRGTNNLFSTIEDGTSANPVVIENVTNQRAVGMNDMNGQFARQVWDYVTFTGCTNTGNLSGTTGANNKIGGFVGEVCSGANVTFIGCTNSGNICGSQIGGFVGIFHTGVTITMTDCHNSGTITGYVGGSSWGIAGGLLGQPNNGENISSATTFTLTRCTNNGNILVDSTAENTSGYEIGGLIGYIGNMSGTPVVNVILDNCGVYGCTIDAIDAGGASHGNFMAAGLIGKVSPQGNTNLTILMKNCYVSKVNIAAYSPYKFIGVGNNTTGIYPFATAENCMLHKVYRVNGSGETIAWDGSNGMWSCARTFTSGVTNFADTDTSNIISGGAKSNYQTGTDGSNKKIRFAATLNSGTLGTYERAGFFVVGLKSGESSTSTNVWITPTRQVYTSIKVGGTTTTAANITAGASYIFLTEIGGIPSGVGSVTFYAVPFLIEQSGRIIFGVQGSETISN